MAEQKTCQGGCHCGKVRFEATADFGTIMACNCSICTKRGYLMTFVAADQFKLLSGADAVTDYQFNKKRIHHLFCTTCGVASYGRGSDGEGNEMMAVNVRCLDDIDLDGLTIKPFDGKSL